MESIYRLIKKLPLPRSVKNLLLFPPGHYYSPLPSLGDVQRHEAEIFAPPPPELAGIDLNTEGQLHLFDRLTAHYPSLPFTPQQSADCRYYYENGTYSYADAIVFFCMIRHLHPKRIVEVGSGFSSAVMLDTNERFFDNAIQCTCIDPFPARLRALLKNNDAAHVAIVDQRVQDVDPSLFAMLEANDILFIDSTHVAKVGSDVNHIFSRILPALRSGVHIHFHDIIYPFEYPREWIFEGRAWNEAYMLKTFLQYNSAFRISFFTTYLEQFYEERFRKEMPLCLKNRGGSIWLVKV